MGASSSGLLDEGKISHIKGMGDNMFQTFSVLYSQQYSSAYFRHLHQEMEPKKEGKGLLLTYRPPYAPEETLYQGSVKVSCWDEPGKKSRERYAVLRRNYKVEIHENMETFSRGCAAKLVLQLVGASVVTTAEESRAHLEQTCAGIFNGVNEESFSVASSSGVFAVYLHPPYTGHTCLLFQQEEERDHFLSALETCIRHQNLDTWCNSSYEGQAYIRALQLYRQDKGCYESWEMLLGTEEQVLASQVMQEVLPWLQSQLGSRMKGKKAERIRQWLATVHATYTLVLEQLTANLEDLREKCRQTASANQALIRSNLDQIMSSHYFLEQKVRVCICEEAEKVCSECISPYLSSILEVLTENISAGIQKMQQILHTQMDSTFRHTNGATEETKMGLSALCSISLDPCYRQVKTLTEKLEDLKQRFALTSAQRLIHSANLAMEQLLDSAVYTLELFLQSSARLQPSQVPLKMDKAKERVLKQLDYDSRVVQRRLYEEALLEITLPTLTRRMDNKWKTEQQQFEQYIFSDYSSFILVHNVYDDVLRKILSKEIETVVQDAASSKSNNLLLDTSDLAISQYSLLGQTPPRSTPGTPTIPARDLSTVAPSEDKEPVPVEVVGAQTVTADTQRDPELHAVAKSDSSTTDQSTVLQSPVIVVTQQFETEETPCFSENHEEAQLVPEIPLMDSTTTESSSPATPDSDAAVEGAPDPPGIPETTKPIPDAPDPPNEDPPSLLQSTDGPAECAQSDQSAMPETSDQISEEASSIQPCCPSPSQPPCTDSPVKISLGSLSEAIGSNSNDPSVEQTTDRAVYLTGEIKDHCEVERVKEEKQKDAEEMSEVKVDDEEKSKDEQQVEDTGEKDHKEEKVEEVVTQESSAEQLLDSVAVIRELVTETTEVEILFSPCVTGSTP
ncbi:protein Niban 1-like [Mastacembelus armatus]|uniref:Protein Niban 1-like n=1 Tax=Mastacembelus armatus TaxID=205130 RepID=A0A3Q3M9Y4_9TELE|nr:protein Niban 1-like [Mastacembelus armatus]